MNKFVILIFFVTACNAQNSKSNTINKIDVTKDFEVLNISYLDSLKQHNNSDKSLPKNIRLHTV